jgi:hypothetical protein
MNNAARSYCNKCHSNTNSDILWEIEDRQTSEEEDGNHLLQLDQYQIIKCQGCDRVSFRLISNGEYKNGTESVEIYPAEIIRQKPKWLGVFTFGVKLKGDGIEFDKKHEYLNEIYLAINNGCNRLAILGIRSLLEHVMIESIGSDKGGFQKNLEAFQSGGHISAVQKNTLMDILELGHAVTHRSYRPKYQEVEVFLDIVEHCIQAIYIHSTKAQNIKIAIPPRK